MTNPIKKQLLPDQKRPWWRLFTQPFVLAILFVFALTVWEEIYYTNRTLSYFESILDRGLADQVWPITMYLLFFYGNITFVTLMLSSKRGWAIVYFVTFALGVMVTYGYWKGVRRIFSLRDLSTAFYSPPSLWRDAIALFVNWYALVPIGGLLFVWWLSRRNQEEKDGRAYGFAHYLLVVLIFVTAVSAVYHGNGRNTMPTTTFAEFYRILVIGSWQGVSSSGGKERLQIEYESAEVPTGNIVLIIDESIRGDHLSINGYEHATTPYLDELAQSGWVTNWGIASASATCSLESNAILNMGLPSLPDTEQVIDGLPTIFQYAKAMGYNTYQLDAQADYLWTGVGLKDLDYVDHRVTIDMFGTGVDADLEAAQFIYELTQQSVGNFVLLNKRGVHFPYYKAYPEDAAIWAPVENGFDYDDYTRLKNGYDNGIFFTVNQFFEFMVPNPQQLNDTVFVYTSDHGETLSENGESWAHCNRTIAEATVPLLMIGVESDQFDHDYKASHFDIFPTLLDFMGVPSDIRVIDYGRSLRDSTADMSEPRYFLPGNADFARGETVLFDLEEE